jgi:hypothetical protein
MSSECLYQRVLGDRFKSLPEVLRRFHQTPGGGRAKGTFRVQRGQGWLRGALGAVLGMPRAGDDVPVALNVVVEGERERWVRRIGSSRMVTVQWARRGLLLEAFGPSSFSCELMIEGTSLRYEFRRAWFLGIPLPRRLSPIVEGRVDAGENRWRVDVRIVAPFLGEMVRYEGWIEQECANPTGS